MLPIGVELLNMAFTHAFTTSIVGTSGNKPRVYVVDDSNNVLEKVCSTKYSIYL